MTESYRYHRLKIQTLRRHTKISIPDTWECRREERSVWWCGDESLGTGLVFKSRFIPSQPDRDGRMPPKGVPAIELLGQLRAYFDTADVVAEPEYALDEDRQIVHVVIDFDDEGGLWRTYRWYLIDAYDDGVADVRFSLEMKKAYVDDPAHIELVEIFDNQARHVAGWVGGEDDADDEPPRLRRQHFGERVTIRIPEAWGCNKEERSWWCWDRRDRPGKLCVFWDFFPLDDDAGKADVREALQERTHVIIKGMSERTQTLLDRGFDIRGDNIFLYFAEDEEEDDDESLRLHSWHVLSRVDDGIVDATVIFMIARSECDTAHYRTMLEVFSETVPEAELR